MQANLRRKLAILAAVLAAAAFAGGAYAATQDSGANRRQAFLDDVAKRLKVTPEQLTAALHGAFLDQLAAAVADGKLTQAQADAIKRHMQQDGGDPFGGWHRFGPFGGFGPDGSGGPATRHPPGFFGRDRFFGGPGPGGISAAAKYLGLSDVQLLGELGSGKSLAQIARARGKSTAGIKDAITTALRAMLDKARTSGMITSAQEQQILSRHAAEIEAEINRAGFALRGGFRGGAFSAPPVPVPPPPSGSGLPY